MADIFISYAREDYGWAEQFNRALNGRGWSVFWDRQIPTGSTWRAHLGDQLKQARCVIVLWSSASLQSDFVQDEASEAKERGVLLPVVIEEGVRPPLGFRQIHTADFSHWLGTGNDQEFLELAECVEGLLQSSSSGSPEPIPASHATTTTDSLNFGAILIVTVFVIVVAGLSAANFFGSGTRPVADASPTGNLCEVVWLDTYQYCRVGEEPLGEPCQCNTFEGRIVLSRRN